MSKVGHNNGNFQEVNHWGCLPPSVKLIFVDPATMQVFDEERNLIGKAEYVEGELKLIHE